MAPEIDSFCHLLKKWESSSHSSENPPETLQADPKIDQKDVLIVNVYLDPQFSAPAAPKKQNDDESYQNALPNGAQKSSKIDTFRSLSSLGGPQWAQGCQKDTHGVQK